MAARPIYRIEQSRFVRRQRRVLVAGVVLIGLSVIFRASWIDATAFSLWCSVLGLFVGIFLVFDRPDDVMATAKLSMILYGLSFGIAPIWLGWFKTYWVPYFGDDVIGLFTTAAAIGTVGFISLASGYMITRSRSGRPPILALERELVSRSQRIFMTIVGAGLLMFGVFCYFIVISHVGGFGNLLTYTEGRADIFHNMFGGWFWGMLIIIPGYCLIALAHIKARPWSCLMGAVLIATAFFPLQGRDLVVAPMFCWLTLYHHGNRRLSWQTVSIGFVGLMIISAFLGSYRSAHTEEDRLHVDRAVGSFVQNFGSRMTEVLGLNVQQLSSVAIAARYIELGNKPLGPSALLVWASPIDRQLLDNSLQADYTGQFMDVLIYPEHQGWNTALSPSLPGELFISLGWFGIVLGMFLYGALLRVFRWWEDGRYRAPILFAAYPYVSFMIIKMLVDGSAQLFGPLLVLSVVAACAMIGPKTPEIREYE